MSKTASEHPTIHAQHAVTEETPLVQVNMMVNGRVRAKLLCEARSDPQASQRHEAREHSEWTCSQRGSHHESRSTP